MSEKSVAIEQIQREIEQLTASPLYAYRVENGFRPVIGAGSLDAEVVFIGEAPGKQEARTGQPFVGASGRVLDELLAGIGLQRTQVYITNIVNDRPPDNRDPRAEELALYSPFLVRQLEIIRPKVIATLGRFAMDFVLDLYEAPQAGNKISQLHGTPIAVEKRSALITVIPLFHPAVALYTQAKKPVLEEDFRTLSKLLADT
jgi:uracil-DNA glycosylase family 4